MTRELERRGHAVTLGCRRGTEQAVGDRARARGRQPHRDVRVRRRPAARPPTSRDVRRAARAPSPRADVVHVHRGKEHWLAVVAARLAGGRPIVRTRHIAQAVRPARGQSLALRPRHRARRDRDRGHPRPVPGRRAAAAASASSRCRAAPTPRRTGRAPADPAWRSGSAPRTAGPLVGMVVRTARDEGPPRRDRGAGAARRARACARTSPSSGAARMEPALREAVARAGLESPGHLRGLRGRRARRRWRRSTSASTCRSSPTGCRAWSSSTWPPARPLIASRVGVVPEVLVRRRARGPGAGRRPGRAGRRR